MLVRSMGEDAYFAASNSAKGFFSHYADCFDNVRIDHLYAIKGGPGTGKSRFLREVADYGQGLGWACEKIYCSSDPDSLDGVILTRGERGIALLDATAPHVYEPRTPGAREELVNLGVFWDSEALKGQKSRIELLQRKKGASYRRAYRYLAAAGELTAARDLLVEPYIRAGEMRAYAKAQMRGVDSDGVFLAQTALMGSLGMRGRVYLDTYFEGAKELILIEDCRGIGYRFLAELFCLARETECRVRVSYDPLMPERLDAIAFLESGRTFAIAPRASCVSPSRTLSMRRFLETSRMDGIRQEATRLSRLIRAMLSSAVGAMEDVRAAHFALEEIYSAAMNFDAKETFTKIFCRELFDLQDR